MKIGFKLSQLTSPDLQRVNRSAVCRAVVYTLESVFGFTFVSRTLLGQTHVTSGLCTVQEDLAEVCER